MKKTYRVEMMVPCVEVHAYSVEADSIEEATLMAYTNHSEGWVPDDAEYFVTHHEDEDAQAYISEL